MPPLARLTVILALAGCAGSRPALRSPAVGQPLEVTAVDLDGRPADLPPGPGVVRVVDFWATWCEPCREALPRLDAMARELGPRGLRVYGVSFDDDQKDIEPFLREVPVAFPILWDRGGARLASRYGVVRLPTTLIADRSGVIRYVHEGWTPEGALEQRRQVEELLRER